MPESPYKGKLRVRVNGLLVQDNALLMVKMRSPVSKRYVWLPPGGGLEYGETMKECLAREFHEETGLQVMVGELRHVNELLEPPFHALEFYFSVTRQGGTLELGDDPEHTLNDQILEDLQFIPFREFNDYSIEPGYVRNTFPDEYRQGKQGISYSATASDT